MERRRSEYIGTIQIDSNIVSFESFNTIKSKYIKLKQQNDKTKKENEKIKRENKKLKKENDKLKEIAENQHIII